VTTLAITGRYFSFASNIAEAKIIFVLVLRSDEHLISIVEMNDFHLLIAKFFDDDKYL